MPFSWATIFFLKNTFIAGGPDQNFFETIRQTLVLALGLSNSPFGGVLAVVIVFAIMVAGLQQLIKDKSAHQIYFFLILAQVPFALLVIRPPQYLHFRYFLICLPFLYILAAHLLGRLYAGPKYGKALAITVVLFCCGNLGKIHQLMVGGRGDYKSAVTYLTNHTPGNLITLGSDHDLANGMVLSFYNRFLPGEKKIKYYNIAEWPVNGLEWVLLQSQKRHTCLKNK